MGGWGDGGDGGGEGRRVPIPVFCSRGDQTESCDTIPDLNIFLTIRSFS